MPIAAELSDDELCSARKVLRHLKKLEAYRGYHTRPDPYFPRFARVPSCRLGYCSIIVSCLKPLSSPACLVKRPGRVNGVESILDR